MIYELVLRNFDCSLEFVFFSSVTSAFQLFTRKLCLQFSGLRMRNFTWNRSPIKNLLIASLLTPIVESTYLNVCLPSVVFVTVHRMLGLEEAQNVISAKIFWNCSWRYLQQKRKTPRSQIALFVIINNCKYFPTIHLIVTLWNELSSNLETNKFRISYREFICKGKAWTSIRQNILLDMMYKLKPCQILF